MRARSPRTAAVALLAAVAALGTACRDRRASAGRDGPSPAADALIAQAATPEERRALERVRDEIDAQMRERLRALDHEIERLRRENDELRRRRQDR